MVGAFTARQVFCRMILGVSVSAGLAGSAWSQDSGGLAAEYEALLEEISNVKTSIEFQRAQTQTQQLEIDSLRAQIEAVPALKDSVAPMLQAMSAEIEKEIAADVPFKLAERYDRLAAFQEAIAEGTTSSPGEQMRRALSIYGIEAGYGSTVEAYAGDHPDETRAGERYAACEADLESLACGLDDDQKKAIAENSPLDSLKGGLLDGDYLRYGRLSLVYSQHDGSEALRYDPLSKEWVELGGNQRLEIRRAVRMAKGESAPAVVNAPIYVK